MTPAKRKEIQEALFLTIDAYQETIGNVNCHFKNRYFKYGSTECCYLCHAVGIDEINNIAQGIYCHLCPLKLTTRNTAHEVGANVSNDCCEGTFKELRLCRDIVINGDDFPEVKIQTALKTRLAWIKRRALANGWKTERD